MTPQKQNSISTLPTLSVLRLENLFNIYSNDKNYFYNLIGTVNIPKDLDPSTYATFTVTSDYMPWTLISYKAYNTIDLWWLICSVNNIQNPTQFPKAGTTLKILTPAYVSAIVQQLNTTNA
jgi:hypothetical protein